MVGEIVSQMPWYEKVLFIIASNPFYMLGAFFLILAAMIGALLWMSKYFPRK